MTDKPAIIARYWYSIDWDVAELWALDLPRRTVAVTPLMWHMDVPVWPDPDGNTYRTTPAQVLGNPARHRREYNRIMAADLSFPLEVLDREGRLMILDGIHRLARAVHLHRDAIEIRDVPVSAVRKL